MGRPLPLPRPLTLVVVTLVAVALVASFRATPHIQKGRLAVVRPSTQAAPAPAPATRSPARPAQGATSSGPPPPPTRRVAGAGVDTQYGVVQVRITMRGARIVSITELALPFDRRRSQEISQVAAPLLRSEALKAQSARIDVVSGATYTSNGYAQSLQSALDRAGA
jgi:uncharacterized protein with FMN-binding domain